LEFTSSGDFSNTDRLLASLGKLDISSVLHSFGQQGVDALARATPVESGLTAASWDFEVTQTSSKWTITWLNHHVNQGVPIAVILEYGHGTGTGGYVQGRDYINPAMRPIFDQIAQQAWKAVTSG
jgi:hypothetical protein